MSSRTVACSWGEVPELILPVHRTTISSGVLTISRFNSESGMGFAAMMGPPRLDMRLRATGRTQESELHQFLRTSIGRAGMGRSERHHDTPCGEKVKNLSSGLAVSPQHFDHALIIIHGCVLDYDAPLTVPVFDSHSHAQGALHLGLRGSDIGIHPAR